MTDKEEKNIEIIEPIKDEVDRKKIIRGWITMVIALLLIYGIWVSDINILDTTFNLIFPAARGWNLGR